MNLIWGTKLGNLADAGFMPSPPPSLPVQCHRFCGRCQHSRKLQNNRNYECWRMSKMLAGMQPQNWASQLVRTGHIEMVITLCLHFETFGEKNWAETNTVWAAEVICELNVNGWGTIGEVVQREESTNAVKLIGCFCWPVFSCRCTSPLFQSMNCSCPTHLPLPVQWSSSNPPNLQSYNSTSTILACLSVCADVIHACMVRWRYVAKVQFVLDLKSLSKTFLPSCFPLNLLSRALSTI